MTRAEHWCNPYRGRRHGGAVVGIAVLGMTVGWASLWVSLPCLAFLLWAFLYYARLR